MIHIIKRNKVCWWCGNLPDSREHKYKKSDIIKIFGRKSNKNDMTVLSRNGKLHNIQGPNSDYLKFEKVLCQDCNNRKSQAADLAYQTFTNYIVCNKDSLLETRSINFEKIFPVDTINQKLNVYRYYIKNFCCRLADNNISINHELINFLNGNKTLNYFYLKFEISLDIFWFQERMKREQIEPGSLYFGPLRYFKKKNKKDIEVVYSFYNYGWFRTCFSYSENFSEKEAPGYDAFNLQIEVPIEVLSAIDKESYENLSDKELADLVSKNANDYSLSKE